MGLRQLIAALMCLKIIALVETLLIRDVGIAVQTDILEVLAIT